MIRVLGIDPGLHGAIALLDDHDLRRVEDMPTTTSGTKHRVSSAGLVELLSQIGPVDLVCVEFTNAVARSSASSMYTFGHGAGVIEGVLVALARPTVFVKPPEWTKVVGLAAKAGKHEHRETAARMFPECAADFARVSDDGRADAALIAEYGRRIFNGGQ